MSFRSQRPGVYSMLLRKAISMVNFGRDISPPPPRHHLCRQMSMSNRSASVRHAAGRDSLVRD